MKLLKEVLARVRRLDPEENPSDELDAPVDELDAPGDELDAPGDELDAPGDELDAPGDELDAPDEHSELDGIADEASTDPDHQGLIRAVKNAHLVYKRDTEDGTFEELWIYNVSNMRDELDAKKAILAGTDIPTNKMQSPDGSQTYEIWSAGNAEMILIKGLPN
jgi:hypothetical protein